MSLKVFRVIGVIFAVFAPLTVQAAGQNLWECRYWESANNLIRVNVIKNDDGALKATYNDGPTSHMTSISIPVAQTSRTSQTVEFASFRSGSSIKSLKLEIYPRRQSSTRSPKDGSDFDGFDAQLYAVLVDLDQSSGVSSTHARLVCKH